MESSYDEIFTTDTFMILESSAGFLTGLFLGEPGRLLSIDFLAVTVETVFTSSVFATFFTYIKFTKGTALPRTNWMMHSMYSFRT